MHHVFCRHLLLWLVLATPLTAADGSPSHVIQVTRRALHSAAPDRCELTLVLRTHGKDVKSAHSQLHVALEAVKSAAVAAGIAPEKSLIGRVNTTIDKGGEAYCSRQILLTILEIDRHDTLLPALVAIPDTEIASARYYLADESALTIRLIGEAAREAHAQARALAAGAGATLGGLHHALTVTAGTDGVESKLQQRGHNGSGSYGSLSSSPVTYQPTNSPLQVRLMATVEAAFLLETRAP